MSPVLKALQTVKSKSVFRVGLQVGCPSLQSRFSVESGLQTTKRRIPARRACHRLSPLRHRSLWGRKVRKKKACETSSASMGLQILVDPASSHMLVSKPFLKRSGSIPPGSAPDRPKSHLHRSRKSDLDRHRSRISNCLVRPWCGPGAGLVRAWQSCVGHRIAASILRWQQHCFSHSCATHRIAPVHYQQLGLGAVLARAQPCDGAGPAVELPGFRHVVDAHKEGQAA